MLIHDALVVALRDRFRDRDMRIEPNQIVFPAAHPGVGDVTIVDDGDEATVYIGHITHGHFSAFEEKLPESAKAALIASDVVGFLEALFADRVLMWKVFGAAGWRLVDDPVTAVSGFTLRRSFVWSGPLGKSKPQPRETVTAGELTGFEFLDPWRRADSGLEAELQKECGRRHPLYGQKAVSVARRTDNDDVLFLLPEFRLARYAVVHLTWSGRTEPAPGWPQTVFYASLDEWAEKCMKPDHREWAEHRP